MKQYKVFANPQGRCEAVKQGWSWPAFFFGWVWALVKKIWPLGIGIGVGFFALGFIMGLAGAGQAGFAVIDLAGLVVAVTLGINGNRWREGNLVNRGYELKETVTAANPEGAVALYVKEHGSSAGTAAEVAA